MSDPNNVEKLKTLGATPEQAQALQAELTKQNLGFADLFKLLPLFVKYLPYIQEFIRELGGAGAVPMEAPKKP
jgi:hypothetical protein